MKEICWNQDNVRASRDKREIEREREQEKEKERKEVRQRDVLHDGERRGAEKGG